MSQHLRLSLLLTFRETSGTMGLMELQDLPVKWEEWGKLGIKAFQGSQVNR